MQIFLIQLFYMEKILWTVYNRLAKAYIAKKKNIKCYVFSSNLMKKFLINSTGNWKKVHIMGIRMTLYSCFIPDLTKI